MKKLIYCLFLITISTTSIAQNHNWFNKLIAGGSHWNTAIDPDGNIYNMCWITSPKYYKTTFFNDKEYYYKNSGERHLVLMKYNKHGHYIYTREIAVFDTLITGLHLDFDKNSNAYLYVKTNEREFEVMGKTYYNDFSDKLDYQSIFIKLDKSLKVKWVTDVERDPSKGFGNYTDQVYLDKEKGEVYFTTSYSFSTRILVKIDTDGIIKYTVNAPKYTHISSNNAKIYSHVAIAKGDYFYTSLTTSAEPTVYAPPIIYKRRKDNGLAIDSITIGENVPDIYVHFIHDFEVDANENLYVLGTLTTTGASFMGTYFQKHNLSSQSSHYFISKLNFDGTESWCMKYTLFRNNSITTTSGRSELVLNNNYLAFTTLSGSDNDSVSIETKVHHGGGALIAFIGLDGSLIESHFNTVNNYGIGGAAITNIDDKSTLCLFQITDTNTMSFTDTVLDLKKPYVLNISLYPKHSGVNSIKGQVFIEKDGSIEPYKGAQISLPSDKRQTHTNENGKYVLKTTTKNTDVVISNIPKYYYAESYVKNIETSNSDSTYEVNFIIKHSGIKVNDLEIYIDPLTRTRAGTAVNYKITAKNFGNTTLSPVIAFKYDTALEYESASIAPISNTNNELTWETGQFEPEETKEFIVRFKLGVPPRINIDYKLLNYASITPIEEDTTRNNNSDTIKQTVTFSYDPNIKGSNQPRFIDLKTINDVLPVEYTIQFQNTGNDTAYHVYIVDTIDNDFEVSSIEVLSASHPYKMSFDENNVIRFDFYNIFLVDSNTNEPMSHGFIRYKISTAVKPKHNDELTNFADIYFDINEPVRTNTTITTVTDKISIEKRVLSNVNLIVYPNPSNGLFTIKADITAGTEATVTVIDATGKTVYSKQALADTDGLSHDIDISTLPQGIYFVKVYANSQIYTAKIIRQ